MDLTVEFSGMPDMIGMGARDAAYILAASGIIAKFEGIGRVVSQSPQPGKIPGEKVILKLR